VTHLALIARLAPGAVFVAFGLGKFVDHSAEVDSFETYGLPAANAFVYAIGMIEVAGGVLLILGLGTRLAAAVLAGNMIGAITVSGVGEGELISLTLAPALLIAMLYLLWRGPGNRSVDSRLRHRAQLSTSGL
jgi:putative oxidoreductase